MIKAWLKSIAPLLIRLLTALLLRLSAPRRERLAWLLSGWAIWLFPKERRKILRNIAYIYQLPVHSSFAKNFARQVLYAQIASAFDTIACAYQQPTEIEGLDAFSRAIKPLHAQGHGLMIVTAHLGSWELVGRSVASAVGNFSALAKPAKLKGASAFLDDMRRRMNIDVMWTDRPRLIRGMLEFLEQGHSLGFVMDQKPENSAGMEVNFMGRPTPFVAGPGVMAGRCKAPIVAVFCTRKGPGHFALSWEIVDQGGQARPDMTELTQRLATSLERAIRQFPEQWAWNYKRWRFDS